MTAVDTPAGTTNLPLLRLTGLLFGVCFALAGIFGIRAGLDSGHWRAAPATILSSEQVGMGEHATSRIVAEFKVGANFYHCGQVRLGVDNDPADAGRYPVGAAATVWYDPEHMARCALVRGVSIASLAFLATGAAALGLAAFAHLRLRRARLVTEG